MAECARTQKSVQQHVLVKQDKMHVGDNLKSSHVV